MEKVRRLISLHRIAFDRMYKTIENEIRLPEPNLYIIQGHIPCLQEKMNILIQLDKEMLELLLESDVNEEDIDNELNYSDTYKTRFNVMNVEIEDLAKKRTAGTELYQNITSSCSYHCPSRPSENESKSSYNLTLPKLELFKFSGDIKDWLTFWSRFRRIHEDESIMNEDKFQYLVHSTIPNSRARQLVESYPPISDNYPKVIESFQSRFGKEDLLIEFYVRELLNLILNNLRNKPRLSTFYDKMESQLRALESLGVTTEKCAAVLLPLVESCVPEETLRTWQRSFPSNHVSDSKERLDGLLKFIKQEVENDEKIYLATSSFEKRKLQHDFSDRKVPTAVGMFNSKVKKCAFCKENHVINSCEAAKSMDVEKKKELLLKQGYCFICLKYGHIARRCRVKLECKNCKGRHETLMCSNKHENQEEKSQKTIIESESLSNSTTYNDVFLQTLVIWLIGKNKMKKVRALIDTGSQRSYICQNTAKELDHDIVGQEDLTHILFGGDQTENVRHNCYKIEVTNLDESYKCNFEVLDQSVICGNIIPVKNGPWMRNLKRNNIEIYDICEGPIEILIGADIAGKLFTGKKQHLDCGLVAMQTLLGWVLMGKVKQSSNCKISSMMIASLFCKNAPLSTLWDLETIGITEPSVEKQKEVQTQAVMTYFTDTVRRDENGRYIVKLPWKEEHLPLPINYGLARKRLDNLMQKLHNDGFYKEYDNVLKEWFEEGIIEEVLSEEYINNGHYLPHRHVVKLNSNTTKLRPVFDASAKTNTSEPSLNQCLETGINLIDLIPSILIRFRLFRIGVISDIRKAFLQIVVDESDRDFLRFLWYHSDGKLKTYRHVRVMFGATCSPFLLGAVINHHLKKIIEENISRSSKYSSSHLCKLHKSFYVDNCVTSVQNKDELDEFIKQSKEVMAQAGFDLRGWEYTVQEECEEIYLSSVLGLIWNRTEDTIQLNMKKIENISTEKITKKLMLSLVNSVFDPIGFAQPALLSPKLLLQQTWLLKLEWNDEVPEDIKKQFLQWLSEINILMYLKIPRWFTDFTHDSVKTWSLHTFCDASQSAYATVIFLRSDSSEGVCVRLVQAKTRITPLKKLTIPRLELLATTIGVRLLKTVLKNFEQENIQLYFWSDSSTVLTWIKNKDIWKPFVANRVQEIREASNVNDWYHVPGIMNPADLASRGCSAKKLIETKWWLGPDWLFENKNSWPQQNYEVIEGDVFEERKKSIISITNTSTDFSWYYRYFSKYMKIVRLLAWIKRFIYNCRHRKDHYLQGELSTEETKKAEMEIVHLIQTECLAKVEHKISSLSVFVDMKGIYRVKTKISERNDEYGFRYPAILPNYHTVVYRMAHDMHVHQCHVGVQGLLNLLRENFWIIGARKLAKTVVRRCVVCQRMDCKKMLIHSPPLPAERVRDAAVFEITGVDLFGYLYLRDHTKIWVCIFTCAVYRAVHLELLNSLSTEAFLGALRRFIARRGRPSVIYSDNGKNFDGMNNALNTLDWQGIHKYSTTEKIIWRFNPPTAAWWGGWWERLIRIIKQLLRKVLGKASLNYEELATVICDIEAVMNNRPLTYIAEDSTLDVLTPAMFLHDVKTTEVTDLDLVEAKHLRRRVRYRDKLRTELKRRFRIEYLGQLKSHHKILKSQRNLKTGDIVLISKENCNRIEWPLGRVIETIPGKDGLVRLVLVKTESGNFLRAAQSLCLVEIDDEISKTILTCKEKQKPENEIKTSRYGRKIKPPNKLTY